MILAGGAIAIAYGTSPRNALLAMNIGAATPAIIGTLATQPRSDKNLLSFDGSTPRGNRVRNFLAFGRNW